MKRKDYLKPTAQMVEVEAGGILAGSAGGTLTGEDYDFDNSAKRRKGYYDDGEDEENEEEEEDYDYEY